MNIKCLELVFILSFFLEWHIVYSGNSKKQQMLTQIKTHDMIPLDPEHQNIPEDSTLAHLRPPKPILDMNKGFPSLFIGLSVFRDAVRCGYTVFTGYKRSKNPEKLSFGVVDQVMEGESDCLTEYCKLAEKEWPERGPCPYKDRIRIDRRNALDSRGPTYARHFQQKLIQDQEFCLQLDGHSVFTNSWDDILLKEWVKADNEMAILTTYLHHLHNFISESGDNSPPTQVPHLCTTIRGSREMIRNEGASMLHNSYLPQLTALWGAGLSFSKCHAERRAPVDPHTKWMFDGEEYLRSSHLWTAGYDLYSPSRIGCVIYHNYTKVPARFEHIKFDEAERVSQAEMGANRVKLLSKVPFVGVVDAMELDIYGYKNVRSLDQYLKFASIDFSKQNGTSCKQLHWIPYSHPEEVETLLNWTMVPSLNDVSEEKEEPHVIQSNKAVAPAATLVPQQDDDGAQLVESQHLLRVGDNAKPSESSIITQWSMFVVWLLVCGIALAIYSNEFLRSAFSRKFRMKKASRLI